MPGEPRVLSREEVIERLATMIRDEAYPAFGLAPPPEWASRAAAKVIDYHQPMLRDHLLEEARQKWAAALPPVAPAIPYDIEDHAAREGVPVADLAPDLDAAWAEVEAALPHKRWHASLSGDWENGWEAEAMAGEDRVTTNDSGWFHEPGGQGRRGVSLWCWLGRHDWDEFGACRRNPLHVEMRPGEWAVGLGHVIHGTEWTDGPWTRVAERRRAAQREAGLALQARLAALGEDVSLELCKDAAWNWSDKGESLIDLVRSRRP